MHSSPLRKSIDGIVRALDALLENTSLADIGPASDQRASAGLPPKAEKES